MIFADHVDNTVKITSWQNDVITVYKIGTDWECGHHKQIGLRAHPIFTKFFFEHPKYFVLITDFFQIKLVCHTNSFIIRLLTEINIIQNACTAYVFSRGCSI